MIENTIINYLIGKNLVGSNVYAEVPKIKPDNYIVIQKTGSGQDNRIDSAVFAVQSYSKLSLYTAAQLNESVKTAMLDIAETTDVYSCSLNSDYNHTDSETKEYRYQAVFNIYY